jgi:hypothetical protein
MKLVPNQNASHGRMVLLAPLQAQIPGSFARIETSSLDHERLLLGAQRLRAKVYVQDGAIRESEVSPDGRHRHPADEHAWHLLSLDGNGEVCGCSRYIAHPNTVLFSQLGIRKAALAHSTEWGMNLRAAIDAEVAQARRRGLTYVEVGGWALDSSMRRTVEAVRIALATYSLGRVLGGCLGVTTATRRHCSSAILRKIGGAPLRINQVELPSYFDPQYECEMEVLRFDSEEPNPRFEPWIEDLRSHLSAALVVRSAGLPEGSTTRQGLAALDASHRQTRRGEGRLEEDLFHAVQ